MYISIYNQYASQDENAFSILRIKGERWSREDES